MSPAAVDRSTAAAVEEELPLSPHRTHIPAMRRLGNYCVESDGPGKKTSKPPVVVGGNPGSKPPADTDAKQGHGEGGGHGTGSKPAACERGKKSNGCARVLCVVKVGDVEKKEWVDTKLECQQRRWEEGDETTKYSPPEVPSG